MTMPKGALAKRRLCAWLIDALIVVGLGVLFKGFGWIASIGYWLLRDGLFEGQSIGKRLMGLKVVAGQRRTPCTLVNSAIRNLLWVIPFVNVAMGLTGCYYVVYDAAGRHWGDRLADTRVIIA